MICLQLNLFTTLCSSIHFCLFNLKLCYLVKSSLRLLCPLNELTSLSFWRGREAESKHVCIYAFTCVENRGWRRGLSSSFYFLKRIFSLNSEKVADWLNITCWTEMVQWVKVLRVKPDELNLMKKLVPERCLRLVPMHVLWNTCVSTHVHNLNT